MKSMGLVEKVPSNLTKSTKSTLYLCYAHMEYDMYKVLKVGRYRLAFDSFPFTAREISNVYLPGFHKWSDHHCRSYSFVIGLNRIIFSISTDVGECCA